MAFNHATAMGKYIEGADDDFLEKESDFKKFKFLLFGKSLPRTILDQSPSTYGLKFSQHLISSEVGVDISFWCIPKENSKKVALLCHGHKRNKGHVLLEAQFLWEEGYTCFLIDFRGAGESNQSYTTAGHSEALDLAAMDNFVNKNYEFDEKLFFGHSMGAVAIFRGISELGLEGDKVIVEAMYSTLLETIRSRIKLMKLPSFPLAYLIVFWWSLIHKKSGFGLNMKAFGKKISIPVLMLHGENDPKAELRHAREIFEVLSSDQKKFVIMPGLIHETYLDKMKDLWTKEVTSFIKD
jgi:alpha-beta hydrolase superfamily lysophospholipase